MSIVVTGASSGIGFATCQMLLQQGRKVFGSVRTTADAHRLQMQLGENFHPLLFDVTDQAAVEQAAREVESLLAGEPLQGLINNAGIACGGALMALKETVLEQQLQINVIGVHRVTKAFYPQLAKANNARIINISSVSGRIAYPYVGPYAASKHALEAWSDSLRRELLDDGIDVIVIEPGSLDTPIWDKAQQQLRPLPASDFTRIMTHMIQSAKSGLPMAAVTDAINAALNQPRPRSRYSLPNSRLSWWLARYLPDRWFDRLVAQVMRRYARGQ